MSGKTDQVEGVLKDREENKQAEPAGNQVNAPQVSQGPSSLVPSNNNPDNEG